MYRRPKRCTPHRQRLVPVVQNRQKLRFSTQETTNKPVSKPKPTKKPKKHKKPLQFIIKNKELNDAFHGPVDKLSAKNFYSLLKIAPSPSVLYKQLDFYQSSFNTYMHGDETPLQTCIKARKVSMARELIHRGSDIHMTTKDRNETPLQLAIKTGDVEMVLLLLDKGADLFQYSSEGFTPLMVAVQTFHVNVVECLLERGALINQQNMEGKTPLMLAAASSSRAMIELLHKYNADINLYDISGQTAYEYAKKHKKGEMWDILSKSFNNQRGPKYNDKDPEIMARKLEKQRKEDANYLYDKLFDANHSIREDFLDQIYTTVFNHPKYKEEGILPEYVDIILHRHLDKERFFTSHQVNEDGFFRQTAADFSQAIQNQRDEEWKLRQEKRIFQNTQSSINQHVESSQQISDSIDPFTGLSLSSSLNIQIPEQQNELDILTLNTLEKRPVVDVNSQRNIRGKKALEVTTIRINPDMVFDQLDRLYNLKQSKTSLSETVSNQPAKVADLLTKISHMFIAVEKKAKFAKIKNKKDQLTVRNKRGKKVNKPQETTTKTSQTTPDSSHIQVNNQLIPPVPNQNDSGGLSQDNWHLAIQRKHLYAGGPASKLAKTDSGVPLRRSLASDIDFTALLNTSHHQSSVNISEYVRSSPKMRSHHDYEKAVVEQLEKHDGIELIHIRNLKEADTMSSREKQQYIDEQINLREELIFAAEQGNEKAKSILEDRKPKLRPHNDISIAVNQYIDRLDGAILQAATLLDQFEGKDISKTAHDGTLSQAKRFQSIRTDAIKRGEEFKKDKADLHDFLSNTTKSSKKQTKNKNTKNTKTK